MTKNAEISEKTIKNLIELHQFRKKVFDAKSTEELKIVAKSILESFINKEPSQISLSDGTTKTDNKGKSLILDALKNDIISLENNGYSDLKNEKFAISSDIAMLMGVFSHLGIEKIIEIIEGKASR
tara:strand:- start:144 stop:521 length:378 start_codon:yes stop_codon:yes gene_type:complete